MLSFPSGATRFSTMLVSLLHWQHTSLTHNSTGKKSKTHVSDDFSKTSWKKIKTETETKEEWWGKVCVCVFDLKTRWRRTVSVQDTQTAGMCTNCFGSATFSGAQLLVLMWVSQLSDPVRSQHVCGADQHCSPADGELMTVHNGENEL